MSSMQQIRPWADLPIVAGQVETTEQRVATLFRRVDVPVSFSPERVALAFLSPRPALGPMRFALAGTILLLGSAGAVAAVRQIPPMTRWLMTVTSRDAARQVRANSISAAPVVAAAALPTAAPEPAAAALIPALLPSAPAVEAPARAVPTVAKRPARRFRTHRHAARPRLALATPGRSMTSPRSPQSPIDGLDLPPATKPAAVPVALATPPNAAETTSSLARETQILNPAFKQLRRNDATNALPTIERYLEAHPFGVMRKEATSAQVEALLQLRRPQEALQVLRSYPFGSGARDAELLVLRGELSAANDCQGAIPDFIAATEEEAPPEITERALFGRAACEARLGRGPEAASSFRAYLESFPAGRYASEAKRQLTKITNLPAR